MKVDVVIASGRAACLKCDRVIPKGEPCIEVMHGSGVHTAIRKVCRDCMKNMTDELFSDSDKPKCSLCGDSGEIFMSASEEGMKFIPCGCKLENMHNSLSKGPGKR